MITNTTYKDQLASIVNQKIIEAYGSVDDLQAQINYNQIISNINNWFNDTQAAQLIKNSNTYRFAWLKVGEVTSHGLNKEYYFDLFTNEPLGFIEEAVNDRGHITTENYKIYGGGWAPFLWEDNKPYVLWQKIVTAPVQPDQPDQPQQQTGNQQGGSILAGFNNTTLIYIAIGLVVLKMFTRNN